MKLSDSEARRLSPPGTFCSRICDNPACARLLTRALTYRAGDNEYCSNICLEQAEGRRGSIPRKAYTMIEKENPTTVTANGETTTEEKAVKPEKKEKAVKAAKKEKAAKPEKKAAKKEKDAKPSKKAAKPSKKAAKKAAKPEKPSKKAAKVKEMVDGNPYRLNTAFYAVFEKLRKAPGKPQTQDALFKNVDFSDRNRMLSHMQTHGKTGERGLKFSLEFTKNGSATYTPSK